jgi:flagellar motility protein MotE (MotC chaperone)
LLCAVALKLCILGSMLMEPLGPSLAFFLGGKAEPATVAAAVKPAQKDNAARPLLAPGTALAAADQPVQAQPPASNLSREAMQRRQEELARKEQTLKVLEEDLDERLERLQALEARLQAMLKEAEETKNAKFRHLVDVLSNMKAKQAAEVLETLDERIAVRVLSGMRGRQAGEILTFVKPAKAARLSEALARVQLPFE